MGFAKQYESFEVRELLREAEGRASPVTGVPGHSKGLHGASPGKLGKPDQLNRVTKAVGESNSQFKNRGGTGKTGAFKNIIAQAEAARCGLNSAAGQAALAVLDDTTLLAKNIRIALEVFGVKESDFTPGALAPHSTSVSKGDANVTTAPTTGVNIIIDRGGSGTFMQIQTCYPLQHNFTSSWTATDTATKAVLASG